MSRRLTQYKARFYPVLIGAMALSGMAVAGPVKAVGDGSGTDNQRLLPGQYPAAYDPLTPEAQLREPYTPFFEVGWSVALRGAFRHDKDGEHYDAIIAPSVSLTHTGTRSSIGFTGSAEVQQPVGGEININALRLGLGAGYELDPDTTLTGNASFALTTPPRGTPGQAATIALAPTTISGGGDLGVTRKFGKFNVSLTGSVARTLYGTTTMTDGSVLDNSDQNFWALDSGLRVGFQATPIFEVFGQAGLGRDIFDKPSSVLLVKTDATQAQIQGGIKGQWSSVLSAQASVGLGLRRFDETSLGQVNSTLYNASVTFAPDETWKATGGFSTTVTPPGPLGSGTTRIEYAATAEIDHLINSWLAVRGQGAWRSARFDGSTDTETGYGYGVGADYILTKHTSFSADYAFEHADTTATGPEDSHRVTLGITVKR
ncbi:outer membrane beta-barrel protein [Devosia sp.]|uniref:outer membrane beta-barrel protein n=1 Tax=Devosia sp. TaxID=1871048 RepID=UPI003265E528